MKNGDCFYTSKERNEMIIYLDNELLRIGQTRYMGKRINDDGTMTEYIEHSTIIPSVKLNPKVNPKEVAKRMKHIYAGNCLTPNKKGK